MIMPEPTAKKPVAGMAKPVVTVAKQVKSHPSVRYPERTTKQPLHWRCINPECVENREWFEWTGDDAECPKCKQVPPGIVLLALIHLLVKDPEGKIQGQFARYRIACDPGKDYIATPGNNEAGTNNPNVANCPGCLKAVGHSVSTDLIGRSI